MIEVKISFTTFLALAAFAAKNADTPLMIAEATPAPAPAPSATVTPEKQQAARDSTAAGKVEKAAKAEKVKNPETPVEALEQAVAKTEEPVKAAPVRTYETSGLAQKIAKGSAKDKPATIALLHKHKALNAEGMPNGKALPVDAFDAFEADIDALLAVETALG